MHRLWLNSTLCIDKMRSSTDNTRNAVMQLYLMQLLLSPQICNQNQAQVPPTFRLKSPLLGSFPSLTSPISPFFFPFFSLLPFPRLYRPFPLHVDCLVKIGEVLIYTLNKTPPHYFSLDASGVCQV